MLGSYVRSFILYRRRATDGASMMNEDIRKSFKDDIVRAEKAALAFSWLGVVSALTIIGYSFWSLT